MKNRIFTKSEKLRIIKEALKNARKENPDSWGASLKRANESPMPAWAAADIVEAAWGGATAAIDLYTATGEEQETAIGGDFLSVTAAGPSAAVGQFTK